MSFLGQALLIFAALTLNSTVLHWQSQDVLAQKQILKQRFAYKSFMWEMIPGNPRKVKGSKQLVKGEFSSRSPLLVAAVQPCWGTWRLKNRVRSQEAGIFTLQLWPDWLRTTSTCSLPSVLRPWAAGAWNPMLLSACALVINVGRWDGAPSSTLLHHLASAA